MPKKAPTHKPKRRKDNRKNRHKVYDKQKWRKPGGIRKRILLRDNYICQECGRVVSGKEAHVDHIDGNEINMNDDNLQTLCSECHGRKTAKNSVN